MGYDVIAVLLVLAIPVAALAIALGAVLWARDALRRAPVPAAVGIAATALAVANLFVARSCDGEVNRAVITLAIGDGECHRVGLASLEVVLLVSLATTLATRLADVRR